MSIVPLITFKAGICDVDMEEMPAKAKPRPEPGYIYLYAEDDLIRFCWRERGVPLDQPSVDLHMVPSDGSFLPYAPTPTEPSIRTNGRIFVLKFASTSQRYLFWMQSKSQARNGDPSWFSPRDRKIGDIVDRLLQGLDVHVIRELSQVGNADGDDDDRVMEDAPEPRSDHQNPIGGAGGAGADATGGDIRQEGESAREGGADGARAATSATDTPDSAAAVQRFLESLRADINLPGIGRQPQPASDKPFPFLTHLLPATTTVPMVEAASEEDVDALLDLLPPTVLILVAGTADADDYSDDTDNGLGQEPSPEAMAAAKTMMSAHDKLELLRVVLHSPQFQQSLVGLTVALRDGGLPDVAAALGIRLEGGGRLPGGMPLGGGAAVEAFVEGIKRDVEAKQGRRRDS